MEKQQKITKEQHLNEKYKNKLVCRSYTVEKILGYGSFGAVFKVKRNKPLQGESYFAVKIEEIKNKRNQSAVTLQREAKILYDLKNQTGFPRIYYFLKEENYASLVLTLLHRSVNDIWKKECNKKFSVQTCFEIGIQLIQRLQFLHESGFIHRDLKPENFMLGRPETNQNKTIYLIDFGLANSYRNSEQVHIPFKKNVGMVGTQRYTSINSHKGCEQSRKDDLESLGYILTYFLKGSVPWQFLQFKDKKQRNKVVGEMKENLIYEDFCKDCPEQLVYYFKYVKQLQFEEDPDYNYLINLLKQGIEDKEQLKPKNKQNLKLIQKNEDILNQELQQIQIIDSNDQSQIHNTSIISSQQDDSKNNKNLQLNISQNQNESPNNEQFINTNGKTNDSQKNNISQENNNNKNNEFDQMQFILKFDWEEKNLDNIDFSKLFVNSNSLDDQNNLKALHKSKTTYQFLKNNTNSTFQQTSDKSLVYFGTLRIYDEIEKQTQFDKISEENGENKQQKILINQNHCYKNNNKFVDSELVDDEFDNCSQIRDEISQDEQTKQNLNFPQESIVNKLTNKIFPVFSYRDEKISTCKYPLKTTSTSQKLVKYNVNNNKQNNVDKSAKAENSQIQNINQEKSPIFQWADRYNKEYSIDMKQINRFKYPSFKKQNHNINISENENIMYKNNKNVNNTQICKQE
ncbi:Protein kinase-like domain [Pseudocohnilembus persalinus]|uniref:Casein kinase I n=1 Tax=Pseudocohnilembus persalinus TaxID=266149 RepID=A0A0V0QGH9_PSEPJ|nr:Protein kinase-like domain [Pseudocohnilembus persalinus]|eukprot:KRX01189.1 Protein kinase-like domain [Pseudocohnilembus persalinus]